MTERESDYLILNPEKCIKFLEGPTSQSYLEITNQSEKLIAYKIKTTCPSNYAVRPSSAVLAPKSKITVQIMLQARLGACQSVISSDRFLIQCLPVKQNDEVNRDFWNSVSKTLCEEYRLNVMLIDSNGTPVLPVKNSNTENQSNTSKVNNQKQQQPDTVNLMSSCGQHVDETVMMQYFCGLEKEKQNLEKENMELKHAITQLQNIVDSSKHTSRKFCGFELWHFPIILFIVLIAWYLYESRST